MRWLGNVLRREDTETISVVKEIYFEKKGKKKYQKKWMDITENYIWSAEVVRVMWEIQLYGI